MTATLPIELIPPCLRATITQSLPPVLLLPKQRPTCLQRLEATSSLLGSTSPSWAILSWSGLVVSALPTDLIFHAPAYELSTAWGLTIAARNVALPLPEYIRVFAVFAAGAMFLHSAACVLNDICDVEFDRQVGKRTLN